MHNLNNAALYLAFARANAVRADQALLAARAAQESAEAATEAAGRAARAAGEILERTQDDLHEAADRGYHVAAGFAGLAVDTEGYAWLEGNQIGHGRKRYIDVKAYSGRASALVKEHRASVLSLLGLIDCIPDRSVSDDEAERERVQTARAEFLMLALLAHETQVQVLLLPPDDAT